MGALTSGEPCLSDLAFDRQLAGELDGAARRDLEAHLERCVRCSVRFDVVARQRTSFLQAAPDWDAFEARVHEVPPRRSRLQWTRWTRWTRFTSAGVVAAVALLGLLPVWFEHETPAPPSSATRTKGGPAIGFYVKRGTRVVRGSSGDVVHPGDLLRFTYSTPRTAEFALLYADAATASIYHPLGDETVAVAPGHDAALDFSIQLDDQLGTERVFGLFCDRTRALAPVRDTLQATGQLPELAGCSIDTIVLDKRAP